MKRLIILAILLLSVTQVYAQKEKIMYVAVKNTPVKESTGFFAAEKGALVYGDKVTVLRQNGNWSEIRYNGKTTVTGWVSNSSLTSRRVVPGAVSTASSSELALAGKGFSADVEKEYRKDASLNFEGVDAVEALSISDNDLRKFITEGRLSEGK